jgi:hypothetical protein
VARSSGRRVPVLGLQEPAREPLRFRFTESKSDGQRGRSSKVSARAASLALDVQILERILTICVVSQDSIRAHATIFWRLSSSCEYRYQVPSSLRYEMSSAFGRHALGTKNSEKQCSICVFLCMRIVCLLCFCMLRR